MTSDSQQQRFIIEAREHLATLTSAIVNLERGNSDPKEHVDNILRAAHSLKGGAGFSGLTAIEQLTHTMETAVENVRDGRIALDAAVVDVLLFAIDRVSVLIDDVEHSNAADISAPLERLQSLSSLNLITQAGPSQVQVSPLKTSAMDRTTAVESEFPISRSVLDAWQSNESHLYGVKFDWFECERGFSLSPLDVTLRLQRGGTVLDARMEPSGPPFSSGLPTAPLWYWTIISSPLPPDAFAQQLEIPCAAILRLENVANKPRAKQPEAPATAAKPQPGAGSLRIPVSLIDRMMGLAGELVLVRNQATRSTIAGSTQQRQLLRRLDALTNEMQDAALRMRMQPVGTLFDRFPRLVRDLSRQLGKQIEIEISGSDVELDKTVLENLADPLTHMVRNCCDHGIESPEHRLAAGKPARGVIRLSARQERGQIVVQIRDDGKGLDRDAIKRKALQQGVRQREELDRMSDRQVYELVLMSGFSTAAKVTDLSGRGVGMDVVRSNLEQIGGVVEIDSVFGEGATFTLRLPLTLAILPCLLLACEGRRFAVALRDVEEVVLLRPEDGKTRIECADEEEVLRLRGQLVAIARLKEVLARREPLGPATYRQILKKYHNADGRANQQYVVILRFGARRFGLLVDDCLGSEEMVVKPLHPLLRPLGVYGAATILGDGSVALILSSEGLARHSGIVHRSDAMKLPPPPDADSMRDKSALLMFRHGPSELLSVPLGDVRRIVAIRSDQIEQVGPREMVAVDNVPTNVVRLDRFLKLSPCEQTGSLFMIMPRQSSMPLGLLASEIVDVNTIMLLLDERAYRADGILGSGLVNGQITLFLDLCRITQMWELEHGGAKSLPAPTRKRILVTEDTEFFRRLVTSYLISEGHEVSAAGNGQEALDLLANQSFDLLVSDIEMPILDGLALARSVRQDARLNRMPLLALTSLSADADRERALAAGFDAYEVKLSRESFIETVQNLLGAGRHQQHTIVAGALPHA